MILSDKKIDAVCVAGGLLSGQFCGAFVHVVPLHHLPLLVIIWSSYPLVNVYITMENHNCSLENSLSMMIFHSYAKLPEGNSHVASWMIYRKVMGLVYDVDMIEHTV